jgi:hypothetical protein
LFVSVFLIIVLLLFLLVALDVVEIFECRHGGGLIWVTLRGRGERRWMSECKSGCGE